MGSSKPSMEYNERANRWELRGKGGNVKFAIGDESQSVSGFLQVVGTSAAVAASTQGTIAISSKQAGIIKAQDILVLTPGTLFPITAGIAYARCPVDEVVNFAVTGSIGVMNWRILAIKADRYLTSP